MQKKQVAVVILNWNGLAFLKKFLPGVIENTPEADIIVADNDSKDKSIEYLKGLGSQIQIIQLDKNYGFCGGYNRALNKLDYKYYLLLNSDVEVSKNWLSPLIRVMDTDEQIAVVQPKIKYQADKKMFEYAGAAGGCIDYFGYPFCRGRLFDTLEEDKGQYQTKEIFWASGACFMIRSEMYHKYGGLDEHFFAHMEEIDLCWKLKNHSYKILCVAESEVFHVGGGTLPKSNPRKTYLNHRNGLFLMHKNLDPKIRSKRILYRMILDGISALTYLLKGNIKDVYAVINAHRDFRKTKNKLSNSDKFLDLEKIEGYYQKSIVKEYFLRGVRKFSRLPGI